MGVIYKAYDPELDRPVALKLLPAHSTGQGERLLREAQALAQLSHPNVIAVHDVGMFAGDVFIAMEFVDGDSLGRWLAVAPRTRAEIMDVFLAAGEGLAAAHGAGLVHRDFKPDNVIVGHDGRVRVLDFGLARTAQARSAETAPPSEARTRSLDGERTVDARRSTAEGARSPTPQSAHPPTSQSARPPTSQSAQPAAAEGARPAAADATPTHESDPSADPSASPTETVTRETGGDEPATVTARFGARLLASDITRAGHIVGTPRFMAPEQHVGHAVDARADQFSFCVSLYHAVYKSFPFEGDLASMERDGILPPPPHSTVPRWLRHVLLRGLALDPAARFPSMIDLLAALRADPARARSRRLRAALTVLAVAAVLAAAVVGGLAWRVRRGVVEQTRLAQKFGQEVAQISSLSRYSALLPLHDTRPETAIIAERMAHLSAEMDALGPIAVGPGHEALGRGQLALERWDEALVELERAYASGYRSHELAWALGMTHGKLYQRALAAVRKSGDEKVDAAALAELARAHRDPALRYLKEAGAGSEATEYVEGLIALYEQRFDDADAFARKAAARAPWLYEAPILEGDTHLMSARRRSWKGDIDGALGDLERAGDAYRAAAVVARSAEAAYLGDCQRLVERANVEVERDISPAATVTAALAACENAAKARPDDAEPLESEALAWQYRGSYEARHGSDPTPSQEKAIALADRAHALNPKSAGAETIVAAASLAIAERRMQGGGDVPGALSRALEHGQRAISLGAGGAPDYALLCHILFTRGLFEEMRGEDPRPSYRAAVDEAKRATARAPNSFPAWNALGIANQALSSWEGAHGLDPREALDRAVDAYLNVVRIVPTLDHGFINLCDAYINWGDYEIDRGLDPRVHLRQATDSCDEAIRINGDYYGSHLNRGEANRLLATWQVSASLDPTATLAVSRASLERALKIGGETPEMLVPLGHERVLEGRWAAAHGGDAAASFAAAAAFAKRAAAASHDESAEAYFLLAELHRFRADWLAARHESSTAEVREGLAAAARALALNPKHARAAATAAGLHLVAARTAATADERARAAAAAKASFAQALAVDGNLVRECSDGQAEVARLAMH
jgi:eukaryotic-like serine/threonine-protein kinase